MAPRKDKPRNDRQEKILEYIKSEVQRREMCIRDRYTEFLLHLGTEIGLVASDYRYDLLNVLPDKLFQHDSTDIVSAALVLVGTMGRADEEVLPLFKIAGGGVVELLLTVVAE